MSSANLTSKVELLLLISQLRSTGDRENAMRLQKVFLSSIAGDKETGQFSRVITLNRQEKKSFSSAKALMEKISHIENHPSQKLLRAERSKACEPQIAAGTKQTLEVLEFITTNAPAGTETAAAALRPCIESAGKVFESAQKVATQTAEAVESSIHAAAAAKAASLAAADAAPVRKTTAR